jgi:hypothetical protein
MFAWALAEATLLTTEKPMSHSSVKFGPRPCGSVAAMAAEFPVLAGNRKVLEDLERRFAERPSGDGLRASAFVRTEG